MAAAAPIAVADRRPGARKVHCRGLWSIGPHEEHSADGHEKLINIGFPILRDPRRVFGAYIIAQSRSELKVNRSTRVALSATWEGK
jgi:hypothetical protein